MGNFQKTNSSLEKKYLYQDKQGKQSCRTSYVLCGWSEKLYGGVLYTKVVDETRVTSITLLAAKSQIDHKSLQQKIKQLY